MKLYWLIRYDACEVCGAAWVSPAGGHKPRACGNELCRQALHARDQRLRYATDPETARQRMRELRAVMTEAQRQRSAATRRSWAKRAGYHESKRIGDQVRRARLAGASVERFDPGDVFERDDWICGICSDEIDGGRKWPDPLSVSLDHIVPLSLGGEHSRANTRPAHLICNTRRGNRVAA